MSEIIPLATLRASGSDVGVGSDPVSSRTSFLSLFGLRAMLDSAVFLSEAGRSTDAVGALFEDCSAHVWGMGGSVLRKGWLVGGGVELSLA